MHLHPSVMKGEAKQTIRNHVASLVFGLDPVRHAMGRRRFFAAVCLVWTLLRSFCLSAQEPFWRLRCAPGCSLRARAQRHTAPLWPATASTQG
jgi:hypothetical protein